MTAWMNGDEIKRLCLQIISYLFIHICDDEEAWFVFKCFLRELGLPDVAHRTCQRPVVPIAVAVSFSSCHTRQVHRATGGSILACCSKEK